MSFTTAFDQLVTMIEGIADPSEQDGHFGERFRHFPEADLEKRAPHTRGFWLELTDGATNSRHVTGEPRSFASLDLHVYYRAHTDRARLVKVIGEDYATLRTRLLDTTQWGATNLIIHVAVAGDELLPFSVDTLDSGDRVLVISIALEHT